MLYATKLTSGETILSQVSDVTNFKLLLIQPLSAEIVDQYERVVALVYQKSDEAEIDEEIGVHFQ